MPRYAIWVITLATVCAPSVAVAAVTISEIAWMGSQASPNHEWIELYNDGSDESVDGWTLTDDNNLTIPLAGTVRGQSFAVLERSSDESAPGPAFLLYTGALVNTGVTLTLRRADGSVADQVAGGEGWQSVGGNNQTKETAQYTTAGWRTGTPTPGRANTATALPEEVSPAQDEVPDTATARSRAGRENDQSAAAPLVLVRAPLSVAIVAQEVAYVGQPVVFTATADGAGATIRASLLHRWNFGDVTTATGTSVTHVYAYPGTYVVTLHSSFKESERIQRHEVTVLPVSLSITRGQRGEIQINNDAPFDINVSGYSVRMGTEERLFPPHSIIGTKQTVTLPPPRGTTHAIVITDSLGQQIARWPEMVVTERTDLIVERLLPHAPVAAPVVSSVRTRAPDRDVVPIEIETATHTASSNPVSNQEVPNRVSPDAAPPSPGVPRWPYVALGILISGVLFVVWRTPPRMTAAK
jgi:PKD repeat protein